MPVDFYQRGMGFTMNKNVRPAGDGRRGFMLMIDD